MTALCTGQKINQINPNGGQGYQMYMFDELMAMKVKIVVFKTVCKAF